MIKICAKTSVTEDLLKRECSKYFAKLLTIEPPVAGTGFIKAVSNETMYRDVQAHAEKIRSRYKKMIVLGIGGSSLGGRTLQNALRPDSLNDLMFFENVDGKRFWEKVNSLKNLESVHWVIVSKSGSTIETLTQANFIDQYLSEKGIRLADHCTVITDRAANPLKNWAEKNEVIICYLPPDVGGRFSVLTPVGLLPAAFLGIDILKLKNGAQWALKAEELVVDFSSQCLLSFRRNEWVTLFWSYTDFLATFGLWVQQLWAESLAKKTDDNGQPGPKVSTPVPLIGANDQHSVLQQVIEGAKDKFVVFLRNSESESGGPSLNGSIFGLNDLMVGKSLGDLLKAEAIATAKALEQNGVQSLTLQVEKVDEQTLGALFMLFELTIGVLGQVLRINAYDQPGVELGKRLAKEILK